MSRQALCLCFSATPHKEELGLSEHHCRHLPTSLHHRVGRVRGVVTTPSPSPRCENSASAPSSAWAPLVPRELLPPQPPALTPQRWAVPTLHLLPPRGSPEPRKRCLLCHCPQPRAHTPAGQARRLPRPKIPGGRAPEHQQAPPQSHHLQATGPWRAGREPGGPELPTAPPPAGTLASGTSVVSQRQCVVWRGLSALR